MSILVEHTDLQATKPQIELALDHVGVTNIARGIILAGNPTTLRLNVGCALDSTMRGAHMSRFHEAIDQALMLIGDDGSDVPSLELLIGVIASRAAETQQVDKAVASGKATIASPRITPASSRRTIDPLDLSVTVTVDRRGEEIRSETIFSVTTTGMTACPCAQNLVRYSATERLVAAGFSRETIDQMLSHLPIATHNQRSTATLELTVPGDGTFAAIADQFEIADLLRSSMSSGIHELLKRDDELAVVENAHENPKFVEDCVRTALDEIRKHPTLFSQLPEATSVRVEQINHESIHAHDVRAERTISLAALREVETVN